MITNITLIVIDTSSREDLETFLSEIEMTKKVSEGSNTHVVKMVGCVTMSVPLALVLEYITHGNLRDYLKSAIIADVSTWTCIFYSACVRMYR